MYYGNPTSGLGLWLRLTGGYKIMKKDLAAFHRVA